MSAENDGRADGPAAQARSGRREGRPAFQLYAADFASSPKFRRMTLEERGAYLTLLLDAWMDRGIEPESIADRLCIDESSAARLMAGTLGRCFELRDGVLVNPRQERERDRLVERSRTNAANGSAGGKRTQAKGKRSPSKRSTNSSDREAVVKPSEQSLSRAEPESEQSGAGAEPEMSQSGDPTRGTRRAKHAGCTLEEHLGEIEFAEMRSDIVEGARAWSCYRRERRPKLSPWGPAQWRPALRDANRDPSAFLAGVELSIRQKYQGLIVNGNGRPRPTGHHQTTADIFAAGREAARLMGEDFETGEKLQ
jgi:uncharacterized protein YdaU (DUF1376 family)